MAQHIVDRFLRHAKAGGLDLRGYELRRIVRLEARLEAADLRLEIQVRAQCRNQAEVVELQRPQAERELPHARERMRGRAHAFFDLGLQRSFLRASERLELDLQRGQRLADIVVQIARQAAAFLLLHLEQATRQRAQAFLRKLQRTAGGEMALALAPLGERAPHRRRETRETVFEDVIGGACAQRFDCALFAERARHQHEGHERVRAPHVRERFEAGVVRKGVVRQDQVEAPWGKRSLERRASGGDGRHAAKAALSERVKRKLRIRRLVLKHERPQAFGRHGLNILLPKCLVKGILARSLRTSDTTLASARNVPLKKRRTYKHLYVLQPAQSAAAAGLRYVSDAAPGIKRVPRPGAMHAGPAFRYVAPGGAAVRERAALARIKALAIPPAWRDVWICPRDDCHLQATGRDARGRKQYRYHARWREVRDETKYGRVVEFARALPRIRRRVRHDLARVGLPREKVLSTVVRLLETTFIRVGNEEYARDNESFGLTTLRDRQVSVRGSKLKFKFRGKSGVEHEIELSDPRLAAIVRRMQDLPGEELFQYVDEQGEIRAIESADVNAYIKIAGDEFTSKDFRTWAGTVLAAEELRQIGPFASQAEAKRNIARAIEAVASRLGNTKAVCRKCYVHPSILESYLDGSLVETLRGRSAESSVVELLERQMKRQSDAARRSGADGRSLAPLLAKSISKRFSRKRPAIRMPATRHLLHTRAQSLPQSLRSKS